MSPSLCPQPCHRLVLCFIASPVMGREMGDLGGSGDGRSPHRGPLASGCAPRHGHGSRWSHGTRRCPWWSSCRTPALGAGRRVCRRGQHHLQGRGQGRGSAVTPQQLFWHAVGGSDLPPRGGRWVTLRPAPLSSRSSEGPGVSPGGGSGGGGRSVVEREERADPTPDPLGPPIFTPTHLPAAFPGGSGCIWASRDSLGSPHGFSLGVMAASGPTQLVATTHPKWPPRAHQCGVGGGHSWGVPRQRLDLVGGWVPVAGCRCHGGVSWQRGSVG